MGYAATRTMERVAASMGGLLAGAPIEFATVRDVTGGGVLLALPSLLATGLLAHHTAIYTLPKGYYGLPSIFLLLALMALARIGSLEQLRYKASGILRRHTPVVDWRRSHFCVAASVSRLP